MISSPSHPADLPLGQAFQQENRVGRRLVLNCAIRPQRDSKLKCLARAELRNLLTARHAEL
jgi:hypothetical protein